MIEYFSNIPDPRIDRKKQHLLIDILVVAVCATIAGAESWVEIAQFCETRLNWFKKFLELPGGVPSHDTFGRVFARIDPKAFEKIFAEWTLATNKITEGQVISLDGKALKGSLNFRGPKRQLPLHIVSAWASESGLVLAQSKAHRKDLNELDVMLGLLDLIDVKGCIVTIDAAGTDTRVCDKVVKAKGDFVIALKRNQRSLHECVSESFITDFSEATDSDYYFTEESGHGRVETREYYTFPFEGALKAPIELQKWEDVRTKWNKVKTIGVVVSERIEPNKETRNPEKDKRSVDIRYYITSLDGDAKKFAKSVRSHWSIENNLHWTLDVAFREDESRVRFENGPENFATIRRVALNLLKLETTKISMKCKRLKAGWDSKFLEKVLMR